MTNFVAQLIALCLAAIFFVAGDTLQDHSCRTVAVDVAVVGGGASGSYAAVRLKEDYKKKVVLIEKEQRLAGYGSSNPHLYRS